MALALGTLIILVLLLSVYIVFIHQQLRSINRQLGKRLAEHTRQPVSLDPLSKELNRLAIHINQCLKAEENLRLQAIREEKNFKELIANISHDLRTPLTAVKGYQQLLANGDLPSDQQEKLRIARKHTEALGRLIELFFEYAYLLNAEPECRTEKVNVGNLIAEGVAAAVPLLEERGLSVHFEETPPRFALADREMLARIVNNLIRNGCEHASGQIQIRLKHQEDKIILSFGNPVNIGAALDVMRLFERFYTGDHARNRGTGLGLAIVKLLVERMNGSVSASLQKGYLEIVVELPAYYESDRAD
ncbi:two-component sensor histidine kinase [Bacillus sp. FJAT-27264]|uniref:sensor histidine kinase n=1 Tax=Paenibacillus sp. (strain DSM 101736 / FJAT-27264) TaxID=1850362 RepID=UPI000807DFAD|nr:HAMP domain-containing sensor histidine kinase [Bacillus sp. FJAT-27264]OBZ12086.1 two-component sensor histidine kinase [Bacillus sp. FJAT-27264]